MRKIGLIMSEQTPFRFKIRLNLLAHDDLDGLPDLLYYTSVQHELDEETQMEYPIQVNPSNLRGILHNLSLAEQLEINNTNTSRNQDAPENLHRPMNLFEFISQSNNSRFFNEKTENSLHSVQESKSSSSEDMDLSDTNNSSDDVSDYDNVNNKEKK